MADGERRLIRKLVTNVQTGTVDGGCASSQVYRPVQEPLLISSSNLLKWCNPSGGKPVPERCWINFFTQALEFIRRNEERDIRW